MSTIAWEGSRFQMLIKNSECLYVERESCWSENIDVIFINNEQRMESLFKEESPEIFYLWIIHVNGRRQDFLF